MGSIRMGSTGGAKGTSTLLMRLMPVSALLAGTALAGMVLVQQLASAGTTAPSATQTAPLTSAAPLPSAQAASLPAPAQCPGNPDALGTSRVIELDPATTPYVGSLQYKQTVALERGEVVLTFDDGPLPPMSNRVLDTLAHECVKATYFIVGVMAKAYPKVVQRIHEEGHAIGSHSQTHPLNFPKMKHEAGLKEIAQGFASTNAALEPIGAHTMPFFRFPGLGRTKYYEQFTKDNGVAVFSVDLVADDWMHLKPEEVLKRALDRLEARGSGILLLHDIQPATAVMLPELLRELKKRHFKVVHVETKEGGYTGTEPIVAPTVVAGASKKEKHAASVAPAMGAAAPKGPKPQGAKPPQQAKPQSTKQQAAAKPKPQSSEGSQEAASEGTGTSQPVPAAFSWPRILPDASATSH